MGASICRSKVGWLLLILQVIFIILFATTVEYTKTADSKMSKGTMNTDVSSYYAMFQDVHVMIFVGFGFLMTFLKRYGYGSVGYNFLIAAFILQWSTLVGGYLHGKGKTIHVDMLRMLGSDFSAAAVLISFGALLGKVSILQLIVLALIEIVLFVVNEYIGLEILHTVDVGGSMFVHAFGAYFGLAVSRVLYNPEVEESKKEGAVYHSDIFAMIGTVFLWLFWPSFNSALALGDDRERALINTYYALAACCVVSFAVSSLLDKRSRLDMVHIQNATLAGGVAVGTSADLMIQPYGAIIIGSVAGLVSTFGYKYITPFLSSKLKTHDTCGVNNLHGMPALIAGIAGAVAAAIATEDTYGLSLYEHFPFRLPASNGTEFIRIGSSMSIELGAGRSAIEQGGYQMLALVITLAIAVVGGALTGVILKFVPVLDQPHDDNLFDDKKYWHIPVDEESTQNGDTNQLAQVSA
ncbi:ammonium transporter Rh type A-like [Octopus vulgaris]|uniref:Ammonium transporter Rh type A-like n=1 Tax=Octopus vulgaris TaxID=6645 RepID=A0AA36BND2_OCTVU|nr:ammonium transporter Rh type A-like [Octopus vulgaris]